MLLVPAADGVEVLMIRRASREGDPWSQHMALPGGFRSPSDADLFATALRETREEVAIDLATDTEALGVLPDVNPAVGNLSVRPFVFARDARPRIELSSEVDAVAWANLGAIARNEAPAEFELWRGATSPLPRFPCRRRRGLGDDLPRPDGSGRTHRASVFRADSAGDVNDWREPRREISVRRDSRTMTSSTEARAAFPTGIPGRISALLERFAPQDWLVLGYLVCVIIGVLQGVPGATRDAGILKIVGLFLWVAIAVSVVRAEWIRPHWLNALVYRCTLYFPVQLSYFFFRDLLPVINPGSFDTELHSLDLWLFGIEPAVALDRFVTPVTTEWFAFFYFGYFFVLALHVIPILFFGEKSARVGRVRARNARGRVASDRPSTCWSPAGARVAPWRTRSSTSSRQVLGSKPCAARSPPAER